jgi:hypothetical protein
MHAPIHPPAPAPQPPATAAADLPPAIDGPSAWRGPEMAARQAEWLQLLPDDEVAELEAATLALAAGATAAGPPALPELAGWPATRVPLPRLARRLDALRHEVLEGRGFALLRGLPVARWRQAHGPDFAARAFLALGLHLGRPRPQNAAGDLLGHVRDLGLRSDDPNVRIYQTAERQTFHTDSADIVGLLCLQPAREGGQSALVSSVTLWNEIRGRDPEAAAALLQPLATDRRGEVPPGAKPYFEIPVFNWYAGRMSAVYQRQYVDSAQRFADAPRLSAAQRRGLDLLDALAEDPGLHFHMTLRAGDVQLVHNHTLLHDRTAFTDWPEPERRRHLLRLWLAPPDARPLPPAFAQRWGSVVPGGRGGVMQAG